MTDKTYDKNHSGCFPDNKLNKPEPLLLARDMTLRDHFAGLALQSYMHSYEDTKTKICLAYWSYKMADAMLDERNGKKR